MIMSNNQGSEEANHLKIASFSLSLARTTDTGFLVSANLQKDRGWCGTPWRSAALFWDRPSLATLSNAANICSVWPLLPDRRTVGRPLRPVRLLTGTSKPFLFLFGINIIKTTTINQKELLTTSFNTGFPKRTTRQYLGKWEVAEEEAQQVNIEDKDQLLNADMVGKNCSCLLGFYVIITLRRTGLIFGTKMKNRTYRFTQHQCLIKWCMYISTRLHS